MRMRRRMILYCMIPAAFVIERWLFFILPDIPFVPPFAILVSSLLFLSASPRMRGGTAILAGMFLDSLSSLPFGTYTLVLSGYAYLSVLVEKNIAESKKKFLVPVWGAAVLGLTPAFTAGAAAAISFFARTPFSVSFTGFLFAAVSAVFAAGFFFLISFGVGSAFRSHHFKGSSVNSVS